MRHKTHGADQRPGLSGGGGKEPSVKTQLGAYQIRGGLLKVQYHQGTQYPFLPAHLPL